MMARHPLGRILKGFWKKKSPKTEYEKSTSLVTVIIPTLNEEKLIGQVLANVRKVLPFSKIIISDGGSRDKTIIISRKYADLVLSRHGDTIGIARNCAARLAKTKYVLFVDSDTFPSKQFVQAMLESFKNPEIVCASSTLIPMHLNWFDEAFFYGLNFMVYLSVKLNRPTIAGSCVAYKNAAFKRLGGFDETTASAEDFALSIKARSIGKIAYFRSIIVPTSRRRIKDLGLFGLLFDWGKHSMAFLVGEKTKSYGAHR